MIGMGALGMVGLRAPRYHGNCPPTEPTTLRHRTGPRLYDRWTVDNDHWPGIKLQQRPMKLSPPPPRTRPDASDRIYFVDLDGAGNHDGVTRKARGRTPLLQTPKAAALQCRDMSAHK